MSITVGISLLDGAQTSLNFASWQMLRSSTGWRTSRTWPCFTHAVAASASTIVVRRLFMSGPRIPRFGDACNYFDDPEPAPLPCGESGINGGISTGSAVPCLSGDACTMTGLQNAPSLSPWRSTYPIVPMPFTSIGNGTAHALYVPGATSVNTAGSPWRTITHCDAPGPAAAIFSDSSLAVDAVICPVTSHTLPTPP